MAKLAGLSVSLCLSLSLSVSLCLSLSSLCPLSVSHALFLSPLSLSLSLSLSALSRPLSPPPPSLPTSFLLTPRPRSHRKGCGTSSGQAAAAHVTARTLLVLTPIPAIPLRYPPLCSPLSTYAARYDPTPPAFLLRRPLCPYAAPTRCLVLAGTPLPAIPATKSSYTAAMILR
eukprot:334210-Rhodomonas_salina.2